MVEMRMSGKLYIRDFGVCYLVIESDCLELVQEIEKVRDMNELALPELKEICAFLHRAWSSSK